MVRYQGRGQVTRFTSINTQLSKKHVSSAILSSKPSGASSQSVPTHVKIGDGQSKGPKHLKNARNVKNNSVQSTTSTSNIVLSRARIQIEKEQKNGFKLPRPDEQAGFLNITLIGVKSPSQEPVKNVGLVQKELKGLTLIIPKSLELGGCVNRVIFAGTSVTRNMGHIPYPYNYTGHKAELINGQT